MPEADSRDLWDFALEFYRREGVQSACLHLQDDADADVPLLIFLCFAATRGQSFSVEELLWIESQNAPWRRGVIDNLRLARRALRVRADADALRLRAAVKQAELEAERLQLVRFAAYLEPDESSQKGPGDHAAASMDAYSALMPAADCGHLAHLVASLG
ncbi:MAG: TIGR02444 family protein [Novosphingobium sp.]|nr:TIGR02444 family protein [Novosphingobium sp.]